MSASSVLPSIRRMHSADEGFTEELDRLIAWEQVSDEQVSTVVTTILADIREKGDQALLDYTNKLDRRTLASLDEACITQEQIEAGYRAVSPEQIHALEVSAERIRDYHLRQRQESWQYKDQHGTILGQQITAIDRVGLYVPGGLASYPSSLLMNAIPAMVAGVSEIVVVSPSPDGEVNPLVLAAAKIVGIKKIYSIGGAQAIAALAYGTETVPKVDKIVGPGNMYVATAKKMLFGVIGLDSVAGPSEILVICDGKTSPEWIAMDLFSQAEHEARAQSILISPDADYLNAVEEAMRKLLPEMERASLIAKSLEDRGAFILCKDLDEAMVISNRMAPEHLELSVDDPESWLPKIRNAGAIFLGRHTPEAFGDYCAGPNHVLPTSATARFSSPLGVYDFQKRSSIIGCQPAGARELSKLASVFARGESLTAHARSAEYRGE